MRTPFLLLLFVFIAACSTAPKGANVGERMSAASYAHTLEKNTEADQRYDGFYQLYGLSVTFVNSDVQSAILQKKSDVYMWDSLTAQTEREKMFQENSTVSKFVLVMFVPDHKLVDLHKDNSIWKLYLETNGQRYDGSVKKIQGPLEQVHSVYPSANRFSTTYEVTFNVPLAISETHDSTVIITSTLGTSELTFKANK